MGKALRLAKHLVLRGAALSGIERAVRDSGWRERRLLILCYHGLSLADEHLWSDLYVTAAHLAKRLDILRAADYNVLPLDEGIQGLYAGTLPRRSVAITFDDGFADFYIKAQPLLRDSGAPAVVYLTTYYTTDQRPVFDPLLSYLLWKGQGKQIRIQGPLEGSIVVPSSPQSRDLLHRRIRAHAQRTGWTADEKDVVASDVSQQIGYDLDALRARRSFHLMSPDELSALDTDLIDVQLHTHRHRTPRDEALFTREIVDNVDAISRLMPRRPRPTHFCYPSGDYDLAFLPWLRRLGVESATTCDHGIASRNDDPLLLPRFLDSMHVPEFVFRSWLAGTAALIPRRSS